MKRILSLICALGIFLSSINIGVFANENDISIKINGEKMVFDKMPVMVNDRVLVPMRAVFEALYAAVEWVDETQSIIVRRQSNKMTLTINSNIAEINGKHEEMDVPAMLIGDSTYVPIRFVSQALGKDVQWDETTNTVLISDPIKAGMAELPSTVHREIPTPSEFKRTNRLDDLIYAEDYQKKDEEEGELTLPAGKEIYNSKTWIDGAYIDEDDKEYGDISVVDAEGMEYNKALRINVTKRSSDVLAFIVRGNEIKETIEAKEKYLVTFKLRTVQGGDTNGNGRMHMIVQTGADFKWKKALETEVFAGSDWVNIYLTFTGVDFAQTVEFRPGGFEQILEMADFKITKLDDPTVKLKLPESRALYKELSDGQPWREEALERIEKIRKGDFKVIVKDAEGNVVPDAEVAFDMFEHEYRFGGMSEEIITRYPGQNWAEPYAPNLGRYFNTAVIGNAHKWNQYELKPTEARDQMTICKSYGINNYRGHTLFWPISTNRTQEDNNYVVIPKELFTYLDNNDRTAFDERVKANIFKEIGEFPDVCRWDVVNEIGDRREFFDVWGVDIYKKMFEWSREAAAEDVILVWNDYSTPGYTTPMFEMIDEFNKADVDYDTIGIQTHMDVAASTYAPTEWIGHYEDLIKRSGRNLEITEFSAPGEDSVLQAHYMRDMLILAFSLEYMEGFTLWGFCDIWGGGNSTPFFNQGWSEKPGLEQWIDLVYNKWWTRNETTVTDAKGEGAVRGFYGDYDITVKVNGQIVKTDMAAFHKGYENVLTITLD